MSRLNYYYYTSLTLAPAGQLSCPACPPALSSKPPTPHSCLSSASQLFLSFLVHFLLPPSAQTPETWPPSEPAVLPHAVLLLPPIWEGQNMFNRAELWKSYGRLLIVTTSHVSAGPMCLTGPAGWWFPSPSGRDCPSALWSSGPGLTAAPGPLQTHSPSFSSTSPAPSDPAPHASGVLQTGHRL